MKAYLLIFFFLLFYSIKSTEVSQPEMCEALRKKCIQKARSLIKIGNSLYRDRQAQCQKDYINCMK